LFENDSTLQDLLNTFIIKQVYGTEKNITQFNKNLLLFNK